MNFIATLTSRIISKFLGKTSKKYGANVSRNKVSRHFEVFTDKGKFLFASKDSGKILKVARQHIGNDKVVRMLTLVQVLMKKLTIFVKKK
ncbi:hypothetical protein STRINF_00161 [Streptococcus infantarius subsp. infantarius ATCC BAA-102]|uniref:Uncharacterized protein n=1 Tax=Streptococcus infantarius subsp. infantarius ATCC BAA-102 TaxID=471872 RepID=A0ABP2DN95_9STRE|nr:hypothetical protein STRINF_00161 [Streptococcus infantarius subsp. infantarius ATCC BAA-102]